MDSHFESETELDWTEDCADILPFSLAPKVTSCSSADKRTEEGELPAGPLSTLQPCSQVGVCSARRGRLRGWEISASRRRRVRRHLRICSRQQATPQKCGPTGPATSSACSTHATRDFLFTYSCVHTAGASARSKHRACSNLRATSPTTPQFDFLKENKQQD